MLYLSNGSLRTHKCSNIYYIINKRVILVGWIKNLRNHGSRYFIDLRDRYGIIQLVLKLESFSNLIFLINAISNEWCIYISGIVEDRLFNGGTYNKEIFSGLIEINIDYLKVFNKSHPMPFSLKNPNSANIDTKLEWRFLDLRRPEMQQNFILKSILYYKIRECMAKTNFIEIETPILIKQTSGGARNFFVPSRLKKNNYYALSESPQLFKQILMIAGFDKYFQIVKCFRDEDMRGNRQPEFTQLDMEISYASELYIRNIIEYILKNIFMEFNISIKIPFNIYTYDEAIGKYGTDKPDDRFNMQMINITDYIKKDSIYDEYITKAIVIPSKYSVTKSFLKKHNLIEFKNQNIKSFFINNNNNIFSNSTLKKYFSFKSIEKINKLLKFEHGDIVIIHSGDKDNINFSLKKIRDTIINKMCIDPDKKWSINWVNKFPLFEYDNNRKNYISMHHPFTAPENIKMLYTDPLKCKAKAYDLVINGHEVGGGSIRIHNIDIQKKVFKLLNFSKDKQEKEFSFFLNALNYGTPPHAGIALGLDRLCMLITETENIRDVIAFPKTITGADLFTNAPNKIDSFSLY